MEHSRYYQISFQCSTSKDRTLNNFLVLLSDMLDELQEHVESIDMANGKKNRG
jgi:hypothetical protein